MKSEANVSWRSGTADTRPCSEMVDPEMSVGVLVGQQHQRRWFHFIY